MLIWARSLSLGKNVLRLYWACIISPSILIGVELELTSWTAWAWILIDNLVIVLNNFHNIDEYVFNDHLNNTVYGQQVTNYVWWLFLCFVTSKVKIKFKIVEEYFQTMNNPKSNPSCVPPVSWNNEALMFSLLHTFFLIIIPLSFSDGQVSEFVYPKVPLRGFACKVLSSWF